MAKPSALEVRNSLRLRRQLTHALATLKTAYDSLAVNEFGEPFDWAQVRVDIEAGRVCVVMALDIVSQVETVLANECLDDFIKGGENN